ncbi:MAG: class I SAM-dependent methyltransferase [Acidiferrobacterales bacterium]
MKAEDYDAWYLTPRGRWIAQTEHEALTQQLDRRPGETLLDIGCGTGQFTRRFAEENQFVIGLDSNISWLHFAARRQAYSEAYLGGDATCLPLADKSFDLTVSVTALCFIAEQRRAVMEQIRVTRRRFAVGLLNRHSPLYLAKGARTGKGAYRGAHWHTTAEVLQLFDGLPVKDLRLRTVVALAGGGLCARALEQRLPERWPWGAFLIVSADVQASDWLPSHPRKRRRLTRGSAPGRT